MLLHDFGGADVREILDAIGLEIADLFPPRPTAKSPLHHHRARHRISPSDALDLLSVEAWALLLFGRRVLALEEVSAEEWARARDAVARIEALRMAAP